MPQPALAHDVVQQFLDHMERRELAAAQALLAPNFKMVFPGPTSPDSLAQLVEWARTRYRFVRKTFTHIDTVQLDARRAVVYTSGTLAGEWTDGRPFEGIRFIDRFELLDLHIVHQSVWNDMALHMPSQP